MILFNINFYILLFIYININYTSSMENSLDNVELELNEKSDILQKGQSVMNAMSSISSLNDNRWFQRAGQSISLASNIKNIVTDDNELQSIKKDLARIKNNQDLLNNKKNNSTYKLNLVIKTFVGQMEILLYDYTNMNEKLNSIVEIISDLEKKMSSNTKIEKNLIEYIIQNKLYTEDFDDIKIYIINLLLTMEQLLEYKKNTYIKKNNNMQKIFFRLDVLNKGLRKLIGNNKILNII